MKKCFFNRCERISESMNIKVINGYVDQKVTKENT